MTSITSKTSELLDKAKELFGKQVDALVRQEQKVVELAHKTGNKLVELANHPKVKKLTGPLQVFIRMIRAHFRGDRRMSVSSLGLIVLALVYFISPFDFIPDFLGIFGYADDLSVILAVSAKLKDEIEEFLEWERTHG